MPHLGSIFSGMTGQRPVQPPQGTPAAPVTPNQATAPVPAQNPASPPPLQEIYRYVNPAGRGDLPMGLVNNTDLSDEDFYRQMHAPDSSFSRDRQWNGQDWVTSFNVKPDSFLGTLNDKYQGANAGVQQLYNPDVGGSIYGGANRFNVDGEKLPQTAFGNVWRTAQVTDNTDLNNPNLVVNDPNYGRITHVANLRGNPELGMAVRLLQTIATAGIGALGASSWGMQAVNAGRGLGSGGNPYQILGNLALQAAGVPSWGRPLANMAISQLTKRPSRGG